MSVVEKSAVLTTVRDLKNRFQRYQKIRTQTVGLCKPLRVDDHNIQSADFVSPAKWHLAHTSWFFEIFVLEPYLLDYELFNPKFRVLFNSYYETIGAYHSRPRRGELSRPTVEEVYQYRRYVDAHIEELLSHSKLEEKAEELIVLGLEHEQQHQELMLMDIKHAFASNPLRPVYVKKAESLLPEITGLEWEGFGESLETVGGASKGFAYDNEYPKHRHFTEPYSFSNRLVTNGEYLEFIEAKGYQKPELWLTDGWDLIRQESWTAPLYWEVIDGTWYQMTLSGLKRVEEAEPVCHVSYYEANAFAKWKEARLPTEFEWERVAQARPIEGNFLESDHYSPIAATENKGPRQIFGDVWEWTQSSYLPYPGYRAVEGALGEYNGKFMCNQMVLRGGACVTPKEHFRVTYRNFYYPHMRWQFSGIRLATNGAECPITKT